MSYNIPIPTPPIPIQIPDQNSNPYTAPNPMPNPNPVPNPTLNPTPTPNPTLTPEPTTITNTSSYNYDIQTLQDKLPAVLDDFKKYYVFFNKNPTYSEYQTIFENLKGVLDSINSDLFKITNNVETGIQNISSSLLEINKLIEKEKLKNFELKAVTRKINNKYNGSTIMINEYKQIYNEKYVNNIFLFIGIIISGVALVKVFTNKVP
jgi:hypothetical protein